MAGPYYVRSSDGNDGDDGLSWANAFATLKKAEETAAAGETVYMDDDHQETLAANTLYTFNGTSGNPVRVIVVETDTTTAVASYNCTNQEISGDANNVYIYISGEVYFWGICLEWGHAVAGIIRGGYAITFEKSKIKVTTACGVVVGITDQGTILILIDTDVEFSHAATRFYIQSSNFIVMRGGSLGLDVSYPFNPTGLGADFDLLGVDASAMAGDNLFTFAAGYTVGRYRMKGLKLHATSPAGIAGGVPPLRGDIYMDLWDEADQSNVHKFRKEFWGGYAMEETTLTVADKGLYDGTNPFSVKLVSRAAGYLEFCHPWRYHLATQRVDVNNKTVTAYILQQGNGGQPAALDDDEVWLEVAYPNQTAGGFLLQNDRMATPTTTPVAQADDAGRWQNETNGREQKLEVAIGDVAKEGPVEFWIYCAKANTTIYVCPEVAIA